ncbi:tail fiber domain-containing protein [Bradyrhizobium liaoningense]|uniref:tail fiber domain-containing protein n=1 Tax=Bradyrhizobium liaoningense TaxID=43992 RepID=UPI001BAD5C88|nr:tail fiber domain-containing protein [Bradyrhizobium liaoningense]MBR0903151.1 tail fiber domain-containing protein [Bradyrhizobium liaoningense]
MTRVVIGLGSLVLVAALIGDILASGAALAQTPCPEGRNSSGGCANSGLARSMRQRAIIFSQPKLSQTGAPVSQSRGDSQDTNTPRWIERSYDKYGPPPPQPVPAVVPTLPPTPPPPVTSDRRLKRDVFRLGCLDSGICLYRFRYLWDDRLYVGVMAQEVERIAPEAVVQGPDGYLRVRYDLLGLQFRTWGG